ncbi:hypothetical protein A5844_000141 [Enterococcus sp. 10A9_DIV0425]|uniref:Uncharacterized protein n=1 Tax=Candidatus Enterococcus wittei TaxID=1987383 RepID=A0A2C9XR82_9ENTE|nr:DUF6773 family protein [Enterococcus sp. 10A9_DIV0425]OTP11926.1 hypothetical protein A5844_000141 [Enterococcus sp. 10A9_DIV0425]THE15987.1 hypothetical protein E1H99_01190 [Enterococcus hirae]
MNHKKIKDERIIQMNHKIQSEAFLLVLALIGISLFVKSNLLDLTLSDYMAELLIVGVALIYLMVRSVMIGHEMMDPSKHAKKLRIIGILGISLLVALSTGIRNYLLYEEAYTGIFDGYFLAVLGITFCSSILFTTLIFFLVSSVNQFGQKRLEKKINQEEE